MGEIKGFVDNGDSSIKCLKILNLMAIIVDLDYSLKKLDSNKFPFQKKHRRSIQKGKVIYYNFQEAFCRNLACI